jgi:hypothetical protein
LLCHCCVVSLQSQKVVTCLFVLFV